MCPLGSSSSTASPCPAGDCVVFEEPKYRFVHVLWRTYILCRGCGTRGQRRGFQQFHVTTNRRVRPAKHCIKELQLRIEDIREIVRQSTARIITVQISTIRCERQHQIVYVVVIASCSSRDVIFHGSSCQLPYAGTYSAATDLYSTDQCTVTKGSLRSAELMFHRFAPRAPTVHKRRRNQFHAQLGDFRRTTRREVPDRSRAGRFHRHVLRRHLNA